MKHITSTKYFWFSTPFGFLFNSFGLTWKVYTCTITSYTLNLTVSLMLLTCSKQWIIWLLNRTANPWWVLPVLITKNTLNFLNTYEYWCHCSNLFYELKIAVHIHVHVPRLTRILLARFATWISSESKLAVFWSTSLCGNSSSITSSDALNI